MPPDQKCFSVLVADDSEDDLIFLRMGLNKHPGLEVVAEVNNGEEVIDYLAGKGRYADRDRYPFPDLLVLDLKMPRRDGFEVLTWLQGHQFPKLRVMAHSGSMAEEDTARALELGAHAYRTKAASSEERRRIVADMEALVQDSVQKTD